MATNRKVNLALLTAATVLLAVLAGSPAQAGTKPPPPPPPPGPAYTLQELQVLPGFTQSVAYDVNDRGQVVGHVTGRAAIWETALAAPTSLDNGFNGSYAEAINNSGQVAGSCADEARIQRPVVWIPGRGGYQMIDLAPGFPNDGRAFDINRDGVVVGATWRGTNDGNVGFVVVPTKDAAGNPVCWFVDADQDGVNDLALKVEAFQNWETTLYAINDAGWVVGRCANPMNAVFLIIPDFSLDNPWWKDENLNGVNDLAIFLPHGDRAIDVNNHGQIVGHIVGEPGGHLWRVVVESGTVTITDTTLPQPTTQYGFTAQALNDAGQVVGTAWPLNMNKPIRDSEPLLWQPDTGTMFLESLVTAKAGFTDLRDAMRINNLGQIVGSGATRGGVRGYLATPVVSSAQAGAAAKQAAAPESGDAPCPSDEEPDTGF